MDQTYANFTLRDAELLERVRECRESLRGFRRERERCKRFTYGDQWNDVIEDRGVRMYEREYLASQGNMPLKNNLIRRLVRNVLGVYRDRWKLPQYVGGEEECSSPSGGTVDTPSASEASQINVMLRRNAEINRLEELYARTMEEFLISGMAVHKKWFGVRQGDAACRTDIVSPANFFFDTGSRDVRGCDISLMGEEHELSFDDLAASFARTPAEAEELRRMYNLPGCADGRELCRVYEVWERKRPFILKCHDRLNGMLFELPAEGERQVNVENKRRLRRGEKRLIGTQWRVCERWYYSFLTPEGRVIRRGLSPYSHGRHPYVLKAYPYIDGEIHSFVSDIIDQQKLTNRLISMYDWILRASAKGVLLFPEGSLPDGVDINDVAEEWSRFNGVIVYRPRAGVPLPQQVSSKSSDIGITDLLEIQMKMMEDISGVNGALQGKLDSTSMSGTLYDQQTRNSLTALADLMKSFDDFVLEATRMDVSNLRQFELGAYGKNRRSPKCVVKFRE